MTIRVRRRPEPGWDRPWFETADRVMTIGVEDRLEDAIRQATRGMVALLQQSLGVSYVEAITLGRRIGRTSISDRRRSLASRSPSMPPCLGGFWNSPQSAPISIQAVSQARPVAAQSRTYKPEPPPRMTCG